MLIIVFEFIISAIVLVGSGILIYLMPDSEYVRTLVNMAVPMILTYWFVRRSSERAEKKSSKKAAIQENGSDAQ